MVSRRTRTSAVVTAAALAGGVLSGCFFDSRWLEQQRMQQAAAKHAAPKTLRGTDDERAGPVKTMRIHARATPRYAAEVVGWQKQLEALVDDANRLLVGTIRVELEVERAEVWDTAGDDQSLSSALDQLRSLDAGGDADFVIGLVGSVPRAEVSFHEIGLSYRPGKHIVMRAMADAAELDAILKGLKGISDDEKNKLYSKRKKHKVTTVLLHEIAHSLGVIHERDAASILSPRYSTDAERFSPEAIEWMRAGVRAKAGADGEPAAMEDAVLAILERAPDMWIATERDDLRAALTARVARRGAATAATGSAPATTTATGSAPATATTGSATATATTATGGGQASSGPGGKASSGQAGGGAAAGGVPGLSAEDQSVFDAAEAHEKAGRYADAAKSAGPLFKRYPDSLPVQDLRCRLAMQLHGEDWDKATSECAPFTRLSAAAGKK